MAGKDFGIWEGEKTIELPRQHDAGLYFIGQIHTPWIERKDCPKNARESEAVCVVDVDPRWREALKDVETCSHIVLLYWMDRSPRTLVLQVPGQGGVERGTFALRSPARPNPIAMSVVKLLRVDANRLSVVGLDCLDGTPLIDIKPYRASTDSAPEAGVGSHAETRLRRSNTKFAKSFLPPKYNNPGRPRGTFCASRPFSGPNTGGRETNEGVMYRSVSIAALIGAVALSCRSASAESLFTFPVPPGLTQIAPQAVEPAPAEERDDEQVDPRLQRQTVNYPRTETAGTIIIDTPHTFLYYVLGNGKAIRYGIGVGREGFTWSGVKSIERKAEWPDWYPPPEMVA